MKANNYFLTKQAMDYDGILNILKHHKKSGRLIEKDGLPVMSALSPALGEAYKVNELKAFGPLSVPNKGIGTAYPKELRGKIYTESIRDPEQKNVFEKQNINTDVLKDKEHYDTHDALMMNHEAKEIELGDRMPQSGLGQRGGHISMSGVVGGSDNNFIYGANKTLKDMLYNTGKNTKFTNNVNNSSIQTKPIHMAYPELSKQLKVVDGTSVVRKAREMRGETDLLNTFQPTHMVTPVENRGIKGLSKVEKYIKEKQTNPALNETQDLLGRDVRQHRMKFGEEKLGKKQLELMTDKEMGVHNMSNEEKTNYLKHHMNEQAKSAKAAFDYDSYNKWKQEYGKTGEYFKPTTYKDK